MFASSLAVLSSVGMVSTADATCQGLPESFGCLVNNNGPQVCIGTGGSDIIVAPAQGCVDQFGVQRCVISALAGSVDQVFGSNGVDVVCGGGGDDLITVTGGDDIVSTGPGFINIVLGGFGNDTSLGNGGIDVLLGEVGIDLNDANGGIDVCNGEVNSGCEFVIP